MIILRPNFRGDANPFKAIVWDIYDIEFGQWVEIQQYVTLEAMSDAKMVFNVESANMPTSGTGGFYLDGISLYEVFLEGILILSYMILKMGQAMAGILRIIQEPDIISLPMKRYPTGCTV